MDIFEPARALECVDCAVKGTLDYIRKGKLVGSEAVVGTAGMVRALRHACRLCGVDYKSGELSVPEAAELLQIVQIIVCGAAPDEMVPVFLKGARFLHRARYTDALVGKTPLGWCEWDNYEYLHGFTQDD